MEGELKMVKAVTKRVLTGFLISAAAMLVFAALYLTRYQFGVELLWISVIGIVFGTSLYSVLESIIEK